MFGRKKAPEVSQSVEIAAAGSGVLVQGDPVAIEAFAVRAQVAIGGTGSMSRVVAQGLSVAGHVTAIAMTHREYFQFSPEAAHRLKMLGAIPTKDGFFRSFVRSGNRLAGNLDWAPVNLGPEQALGLQGAAMQMALQSAIKDVVAAIERVEGKVDKLVGLARAERLGAAAGDRKTLSALAERARRSERISATDWSTVASLGAQIARDVEALRAYILREVAEIKSSRLVRRRSFEITGLIDEMLRESLALLIVAEHNYLLWQEIRIARVASTEPDELGVTLLDCRSQVDGLLAADQELINALHGASDKLLRPTGYEGFAVLKKRQLLERGLELHETIGWFAAQRNLDFVGQQTALPTLRQSMVGAQRAVSGGARTVKGAATMAIGRIGGRGTTEIDDPEREAGAPE